MDKTRALQPALNALLAFEEAAKCGSFSEAARRLGMAQPSVSRFVANLEALLEVRLFERHGNRVALTAAGRRLLEATALGFGHIRQVMAEVAGGGPSDRLRLGFTHGFAHFWAMPRLAALKQRLGGREVQVVMSDTGYDISLEEVDFALRFGDGTWPGAETILLFEEEVLPVFSAAFAAHEGLAADRLAPADLAALPLLYQDRGEAGWTSWESYFGHFGIDHRPPEDAYYLMSYTLPLQAAMEGQGVALAWRGLLGGYVENGWLLAPEALSYRTGRGYYLVHRPGHPLVPQVADWVAKGGETA